MKLPNLPVTLFDQDFPEHEEAIYLPLSVPAGVSGGWAAYFKKHAPEGEFVGLVDLKPDGTFVPGYYRKGSAQKNLIPVLRPKLQT
jgi:hypothetical protein